MNTMTFRSRSLFAAAYSHGEAAAADALLHTAFSAHFHIFFQGGCGNVYFSVSVIFILYFRFPSASIFIDALILWPRLKKGFNDRGGRGYNDFVPGEVTKTAPSGDETT